VLIHFASRHLINVRIHPYISRFYHSLRLKLIWYLNILLIAHVLRFIVEKINQFYQGKLCERACFQFEHYRKWMYQIFLVNSREFAASLEICYEKVSYI
jgi:hypothetical protein